MSSTNITLWRTALFNDAFSLFNVSDAFRRARSEPEKVSREIGNFLAKPAAADHLRKNGAVILNHLRKVVAEHPPDFILAMISDVAVNAAPVAPEFSEALNTLIPPQAGQAATAVNL